MLNARKCVRIAYQWDPFKIFIFSGKKSIYISVFSVVFSLSIIICCNQPRATYPHSIYLYNTKGKNTHKKYIPPRLHLRVFSIFGQNPGVKFSLIYIADYYF